MNTWLNMDGTQVVGVLRTDEDGLGSPWVLSPGGWDDSVKAPQPHMVAHLVNGVREWRESRSLAAVKKTKRKEINQTRDTKEFGTFVWDGSVFDTDSVSRARIGNAVVLSMMGSFSMDWTLADNSVRTMTGADMQQLVAAMGIWVGGLHAQARALKSQVDSAVSLAEVDSVSWVD